MLVRRLAHRKRWVSDTGVLVRALVLPAGAKRFAHKFCLWHRASISERPLFGRFWGPSGHASSRQMSLMTDAVKKVGGIPLARNNRIMEADFLNRCCSFNARLESILLGDPPQNPFSTVSTQSGQVALSSIVIGTVCPLSRSSKRMWRASCSFNPCETTHGRSPLLGRARSLAAGC